MGNIAGVAKTFYMTMIMTSWGDLKDDGNPTAMTVMVVTTDDDGPPLWAMGKVWAQVSPHATFIQEVDGSGNDDDGDDDDDVDDDTTHNHKLYEGY